MRVKKKYERRFEKKRYESKTNRSQDLRNGIRFREKKSQDLKNKLESMGNWRHDLRKETRFISLAQVVPSKV